MLRKVIKFMADSKIAQGFTLAEVLITLGIIGVVAAITIPTLMNSIQDAQFKTAYKKAYSVASQAWQHAVADYQIVNRPDWLDLNSKITNFDAFKSYFKLSKDCSTIVNSNCWAAGETFYGTPDGSSVVDSFIDSSGMSWSIVGTAASQGAEIIVDTNGFKGPNKYGYDRFIFDPLTVDGSTVGFPAKLIPIDDSGYSAGVCPSGNIHPCKFRSWLYN